MQYKKLGFCGLVRGLGLHQVLCTVTGNRSEDPQLFILPHVGHNSLYEKTSVKFLS